MEPLRRYVARLVGCPAEAQDVAHDAYARVFPTMRDRELEAPQAYLYLTARRLALNHLRHREVAQRHLAETAQDDGASSAPDQVAMTRQERAQLEWALAQLPPGCRAVLILRKLELLPHDEIARRLGITRSTVEKQQARAMRLLREALLVAPADLAETPVVEPLPERRSRCRR